MAVAITGVAIIIATATIVRLSKPEAVKAPDDQPVVVTMPSEAPSIAAQRSPVASVKVHPKPTTARRVGYRRPEKDFTIAMKSLSTWQSPTASLLITRSDDRWMTLPRLDESLQTLKSLSLDQFN
ncbi:MAG: hypothetical protein WAV20_09600 [Blastocatellia bacterium]